jgi:hypothetical protein
MVGASPFQRASQNSVTWSMWPRRILRSTDHAPLDDLFATRAAARADLRATIGGVISTVNEQFTKQMPLGRMGTAEDVARCG